METIQDQKLTFTKTVGKEKMVVTVRHDDECGNGHNTFAITMDVSEHGRFVMGGCCHDEVREHFPELAHLIKWHLCSTDGPMHYVANTVYHAKGISKHQDKWYVYLHDEDIPIMRTLLGIFDGKDLQAIYDKYGVVNIKPEEYFNSMAKEPNLEYARSTAIWPEATLEQLSDVAALEARLPALLADFQADVEAMGLTY
jgi:hypothetical protein